MQEINKFTARGISKETGKFIYGYYNLLGDKHLLLVDRFHNPHVMFEGGLFDRKTSQELLNVEITQEPDRYFGKLGGRDYFMQDIIKCQHKQGLKKNGAFDPNGTDYPLESFIIDENFRFEDIEYNFFAKETDYKIVCEGNTHNIKEEL